MLKTSQCCKKEKKTGRSQLFPVSVLAELIAVFETFVFEYSCICDEVFMKKKKIHNREEESKKEKKPDYYDEYDWRPFFISGRCVNPLSYNRRLDEDTSDR